MPRILTPLVFLSLAEAHDQAPPPVPLFPIPTPRRPEWQYDEMRLFLHFGMNTFTVISKG